jgi:hypothetical protein
MNDDPRLMFEIAELTLHSLNGRLDDSGFRRLEELLERNPVAVEYYQEILWTHVGLKSMEGISCLQENESTVLDRDFWQAMLQEERTAPAIEILKEKPQRELIQNVVYPPRKKRKISTFSKVSLVLNAAAILFLVLFLNFAPVNRSIEVARILDSSHAEWMQTVSPKSRLVLFNGTLEVTKGFLKFAMYDGTQVSIKAPATVELEQIDRLYLQHGSMQAIVPPVATGFTVRTPFGSVVDFGTEFSVEVDKTGKTLVEVFKGIVELRDSSNPTVFTKYQKLIAGQKGTIDTQGTVALIESPGTIASSDSEDYPVDENHVYWQCPEEKGYWGNPLFWTQNILNDPSLVAELIAENGPKTILIDSRATGIKKISGRRADVCQTSNFPLTVQMDGGQVQFEQMWIGRCGISSAAEGKWIMSAGEIILKGRDAVQLFVGDKCKGRMEVNGGRIEIFGGARIGCDEWYSAETFIDSDGTLMFNDGQLLIYGILEVATDGGTGRILLNGGQIKAFDLKIEKKGLLIMTGGTLILEGDKTDAIQNLIDQGLLLCPDREIKIEYDQEGINKFGPDKTVIRIAP